MMFSAGLAVPSTSEAMAEEGAPAAAEVVAVAPEEAVQFRAGHCGSRQTISPRCKYGVKHFPAKIQI